MTQQHDAKALLEGTTAEPWEVSGDDDYSVYAWPDGIATVIADCDSGLRTVEDDDECAANARLIAAAPDLARQVITLTTRAETAEAEVARLREGLTALNVSGRLKGLV